MDTTYNNGTGLNGVSVDTYLGGSIDNLEDGGYNMLNSDPGIYTAILSYTLGSGYTATLTKTAVIPPIDYSTYQMGIIGDCYLKQDNTQAEWDENYETMLPSITGGTTYTWTYTIPINIVGDFKFRQGSDWAGLSIGYTDVTMAGPAYGYFTNDGGNFKVTATGSYTLVLQINALTEIYTVTATKN